MMMMMMMVIIRITIIVIRRQNGLGLKPSSLSGGIPEHTPYQSDMYITKTLKV